MLAMASILRCLALSFMVLPFSCQALVLGGVEVPHARDSRVSRAFNEPVRPSAWPYSSRDLTPDDPSNDQLFYLLPKFVHHAAAESRAALKDYYQCVLPETKGGAVLDLCSSFTSHYPKGWRPPPDGKCVCLGLNPLELAANPSKSEWRVQNLNTDPILPYADGEFDLITNSLSVDYLTKPLEVQLCDLIGYFSYYYLLHRGFQSPSNQESTHSNLISAGPNVTKYITSGLFFVQPPRPSKKFTGF